jgi:hypothetical protein
MQLSDLSLRLIRASESLERVIESVDSSPEAAVVLDLHLVRDLARGIMEGTSERPMRDASLLIRALQVGVFLIAEEK